MNRVRGAVSRAAVELHRSTSERWLTSVVIALLVAMTLVTAVAVIVSRHEARVLFHELEALKRVADDIAVEWDRLQIEESTFSTHSLVEQRARTKLRMDMPNAAVSEPRPELEYVRP